MTANAIILRLTHTSSVLAKLYFTDLNAGTSGPPTGFYKPGRLYLDPGETIDLFYTGDVANSFEQGVIKGYIDHGYLTSLFVFGTEFQTAIIPTGAAGGQLGGNYPDPGVLGITTTAGGSTELTFGSITDGQVLVRSGATVIGSTGAPPGGIAGGQLGGTYPSPDVRGVRTTEGGGTELTLGSITNGQVLIRSGATVIGASGFAPNGSAGGQLGGNYPNPDVRGVRTTAGGGVELTLGSITDGQTLIRSGATVIGATGVAPAGSAGGQLGGTYPSPDVRGLRTTEGGGTELTLGSIADGAFLVRSGATVVGAAPTHAGMADLATSGHPASIIAVSAAGFSGNLSPTDTTVQTALATIDAMSVGTYTQISNVSQLEAVWSSAVSTTSTLTGDGSYDCPIGSLVELTANITTSRLLNIRNLVHLRGNGYKITFTGTGGITCTQFDNITAVTISGYTRSFQVNGGSFPDLATAGRKEILYWVNGIYIVNGLIRQWDDAATLQMHENLAAHDAAYVGAATVRQIADSPLVEDCAFDFGWNTVNMFSTAYNLKFIRCTFMQKGTIAAHPSWGMFAVLYGHNVSFIECCFQSMKMDNTGYSGVVTSHFSQGTTIRNCTFMDIEGASGVFAYNFAVNIRDSNCQAVVAECKFLGVVGSVGGVGIYSNGTMCLVANNLINTVGGKMMYVGTSNGRSLISNNIGQNCGSTYTIQAGNYDVNNTHATFTP